MAVMRHLWASVHAFPRTVRSLGLLSAFYMKVQQLRVRSLGIKCPYTLWSKDALFPLWCRPNTSDLNVFYQTFILRQYSCLDGISDPQLIIDCGANVGYSSAYFLSRFPTAKVIAVEPDSGNAELLERNLRPFGNRAKIVPSAVWSHSVELVIDSSAGDGREWSRRVRECLPGEPQSIRATTIGDLFAESGEQSISIVKIDIEGAEAAVFAHGYEAWLPRTNNIAIELHGEHCARLFFQAINNQPYHIYQRGELTVCKRHEP